MAATERQVRRRERSHPRGKAAPAAPRSPAVIEFENVSKRYDSGDTGLDGVSFAIQPGEFVFLVGASGSGKSTTIRLLIKETDPTGGTIHVAGRDLADIPRKRVPYYRRNIGVVFQDYKLLPNRTVYENVAYEPTGNLDPETSIGIMQLLYRINRTGTTVVVATHDVDMVNRMRRRVIELANGRVVRDERAGAYAASESTQEFAIRMRRGT
jgi:ABC-type ATPase involved in cell division